ncbi:hypothetical protein AVEN_208575-1 [Araneus ventricosus]|uniref:Uncharacterized protein n=1 Tax=Araneus ventricosus TaxID=182803 RepID=A0A4Y2S2N3_ARAVE|nr:hypothetical protein AVEN_208575-1 [Araneus ventricosus]
MVLCFCWDSRTSPGSGSLMKVVRAYVHYAYITYVHCPACVHLLYHVYSGHAVRTCYVRTLCRTLQYVHAYACAAARMRGLNRIATVLAVHYHSHMRTYIPIRTCVRYLYTVRTLPTYIPDQISVVRFFDDSSTWSFGIIVPAPLFRHLCRCCADNG